MAASPRASKPRQVDAGDKRGRPSCSRARAALGPRRSFYMLLLHFFLLLGLADTEKPLGNISRKDDYFGSILILKVIRIFKHAFRIFSRDIILFQFRMTGS